MAEDTAKFTKLVDDLKSPRPFIRGKAVDALMTLRDQEAIPQLFRIVSKEVDFIKVQFCRWLAKIGSEAAVPPLIIFLLDKSEQVTHEAVYALDQIDNDRKTEALMLLLRRGDQFSKLYAIKSLGTNKKIKALPHLLNLLSSEDKELQEATIDALRQIADPAAIQPLAKLLETQDETILHRTLFALGEIGEPRIAPSITQYLRHQSPPIRKATVWALGRFHYRKALSTYVDMLKTDPSEIVREEICRRLGKMGGKDAVQALFQAMTYDPSQNVRVFAEWGLNDVSPRDKLDVLMKLKGSQDEKLRGQALLELGKTGEEKYGDLLNRALEEKSDYVRNCAAQGLTFIRKQRPAKQNRIAL